MPTTSSIGGSNDRSTKGTEDAYILDRLVNYALLEGIHIDQNVRQFGHTNMIATIAGRMFTARGTGIALSSGDNLPQR